MTRSCDFHFAFPILMFLTDHCKVRVPSVGIEVQKYVQQKKQFKQTIKSPGELYCLFPSFLL